MFKPSKPCPFCASENLSIETLQVMGHNEYAVMCKNCGSFGPNDLGQSGAVEMWDLRRVPAAQQMRAADVLPCGHTQDHESMLLETGEFVCDQCGAIHR